MATKNEAVEEYGRSLKHETWGESSVALLRILAPAYRALNSAKVLASGKMGKIKPYILTALENIGVDEIIATSRTFVMLVRPIKFPVDFEKAKAIVPGLRKILTKRYGKDSVRGRIHRVRVVSYKYVIDDDLRRRIEEDNPDFRREVSIYMKATPELRVTDIPDRAKLNKKRKGR